MPSQQSIERAMIQEPLEWSIQGPFAGVQSDCSLDKISMALPGFWSADNVLFMQDKALFAPGWLALPAVADGNPIVGVYDFFDNKAVHRQFVLTTRNLYLWSPTTGVWSAAVTAGVALGGIGSQRFAFTVVNNQVLFSQGVDPVQSWDGAAVTFAAVSPDAVPAYYLTEVKGHLIAGYTVEAGDPYPTRLRWTAAGDPSVWIPPAGGTTDLLNSRGFITALANIRQYGWAFQYAGVTQIVPTGVGTAPFAYEDYGGQDEGCTHPSSFALFGHSEAVYANWGDIIHFDGTNFNNLSYSKAQDVNGKVFARGARTRIYQDLLRATSVNDVVSIGIVDHYGTKLKAYLLSITTPSQATDVLWIYNFDEDNWSRLRYNTDGPLTLLGRFYNEAPNTSPYPVSDWDFVGAPNQFAFTQAVTKAAAGGSPYALVAVKNTSAVAQLWTFGARASLSQVFITGIIDCGIPHVTKTLTGVYLDIVDVSVGAQPTYAVTVYNEKGQNVSLSSVSPGTGSGDLMRVYIPATKLNALFFTVKLSIDSASGGLARPVVARIALQYILGGKFKNA